MTSFGDALNQLWPHGDAKIPGLRAAIIKDAPRLFEAYGLNTKTAMLQFMAQISHECGAGLEVEENLSYSAERMVQVWPSRFPSVEAAMPYAHNPRALANKVYNGRMGNRIGSDDGYNFRGRGGTQVTGREGYAAVTKKVGFDFLTNPMWVNQPKYFLEVSVADFVICGCLFPAISNDINEVTKKLNGGYVGLDQRKEWLSKWTALNVALPIAVPTSQKPKSNVPLPAPPPAPPASTPVVVSRGGFWSLVADIFRAMFLGSKK